MSDGRPPLTVIVPIFNEEQSLVELHARLRRALSRDAEILIVDDGSTDGSAAILTRLAQEDPALRWIQFGRNFGKSMALAAGFRRARGVLVATIDGDLQEDPTDISRLADSIASGFDLAGGWRIRRRDAWTKVWASKIFNRTVGCLAGVRFRDVNCGLKVMRREVLEDMNLAGGFHRFIPLLAHWKGFRTTEIPIEHRPRQHGKSRYRGDRFFRGLLDLVVILFLVRFQGRPGRYFVALGGLLSGFGFTISAYLAYLRLATGSIQSRFPLLALGLVLVVVGVQSLTLGLFGELLAYHFRATRPLEPAVREFGGQDGGHAAAPEETLAAEGHGASQSAGGAETREAEQAGKQGSVKREGSA